MGSSDYQNEDEWQDIKKKFESEGIKFSIISSKQKILYLWRWLVDAENNLNSSRKMLDKLREQHSEEVKEVENYVEYLQRLNTEKIEQLEKTNLTLKQENDTLRTKSLDKITAEVSEMLTQEGLHEIINTNIGEQVAYLLVLRCRLMEELEVLQSKLTNSNNLMDTFKSNITQLKKRLEDQKLEFEEELRNERELTKEVKESLRRSHDEEISQLQDKLKSTQKLVDELEGRLNSEKDSCKRLKNDPNSGDGDDDFLEINQLREKLTHLEDRFKKVEISKRQLEIDNETLTFKVSELLSECEEKESQLRRERMNKVGARTFSKQTSTSDSPKRFQNQLDNKVENKNVNSQQEVLSVQQVKKLQRDVENLQEQLLLIGGRYDALATKYQQKKSDGRTKIQKIRDAFNTKQTHYRDQIDDLESALSAIKTSVSWEKECRQKIQSDFASLQKEKGDILRRLLDTEENLRDKNIEIKTLTSRLELVEKENAKVVEEIGLLKKLALKEVLNSSNQEESKKRPEQKPAKPIKPHWLQKNQVSHGFNRLEKVLVPASENRQEVTV